MNRFISRRCTLHLSLLFLPLVLLGLFQGAFGLGQTQYVVNTQTPGSFTVARSQAAAPIYVDPSDHAGVIRAVGDLQADVERVTQAKPSVIHDVKDAKGDVILVGTIGKSRVIDQLIRARKINVSPIRGKWEAFLVQVVPNPLPGVTSGLVIAGSDKRGTIYGIYDLSEQMGVSPWYWWADVPVQQKDAVFVKPGRYVQGEPAVKYRGIFLNDEAPALTGWVREKFGDYNHQFYTKVFELLLRLKANYLWPAMWDNAFNEDDPLNPKLADEWGIVMGTSHHEPMLRAQQEWKRHGTGPWDYSRNAEVLRKFWREGVRRNKNYESITTIGMRGDGDMPMTESANIELLERIVADQQKVLAEEVNPDVTKIPQDWALYKEVQEYYEKGMRVPDDVTLLWCDDNWGNIRRLPTPEERKRSGGAGIYYHFDYVGGPRSYKWLNTNPIAKVWEQMNLAYHYDANRIWIVNVGDLKPMEFPIEFFLTFARNPNQWPKEKIGTFTRMWAKREFGAAHANEIADIVSRYTKYNGRRKPELIDPGTFSVTDYREADRVVGDWREITDKAEKLYRQMPQDQRSAFYELVLHPTKASATVTEMYVAAAKNRLYAGQGRARTNEMAARVRALFDEDAALSDYFNHKLAGGKWDHMMDQTHIGYTYWQQPPANTTPKVETVNLSDAADMGVAVEGSALSWPGPDSDPTLPQFDVFNQPSRYIDVFNKGKAPFEFSAAASAPWILMSSAGGKVEQEQRIWVNVDWAKVPWGRSNESIKIAGPGAKEVTVKLSAFKPQELTRGSLRGFVEADGYVSMEAVHYTNKADAAAVRWEPIADLGRTLSAMTIFPVTAPSVVPPLSSPHLEYTMYVFNPGKVEVEAILDPTLNFVPGRGLRYAISFDDEPPQIVDALAQNTLKDWERSVSDAVRKSRSTHTLTTSGYHTLKFWMVDPGVVLQKVVVDLGGVKPSYLGPPESFRNAVATARPRKQR